MRFFKVIAFRRFDEIFQFFLKYFIDSKLKKPGEFGKYQQLRVKWLTPAKIYPGNYL